jgi:FG-GAP repeat protein
VIGAPNKDCSKGVDCGAAYVFTRAADGAWTQEQKLVSVELDGIDHFGRSVALSRDGARALIGASGVDCGAGTFSCGAVYEFVRNGASWTEVAKIPSPLQVSASGFGNQMALSGDGQTLIVARFFDIPGGNLDVFRRSGGVWVQEATIAAPGDCSLFFGQGLDVSDDGNTVLVSEQDDFFCLNPVPSRVFVYARQGGSWAQQAELIPKGPLGRAVALSGDGNKALVGVLEPNSCTEGLTGRVAFVFTRQGETWSEEGPLLVRNPRPAMVSTSVGLSNAGDLAAAIGYVECKNGGFTPVPEPDSSKLHIFGDGALTEVPALSGLGLAALALALAAAGAALLRR